MALQKSYSKEVFGQTVTFDNAYHQITFVSGDKTNINIQVTIYDTPEKQNVIDFKSYQFVPNISDTSSNFYKQGYEIMKAKPEYENAIDVLEDGQAA